MTRAQATAEARRLTGVWMERYAVVTRGCGWLIVQATRTRHLQHEDILAIYRPEPDGSAVLCGGTLLREVEVGLYDGIQGDAA